MLKTIFFILLSFNLFALELSLEGAKEEKKPFSTLHIKEKEKFLCQEFKDDFDTVTKIVCAFSKHPSQEIKKLQNSFFEITTQTKDKTFFIVIKPFKKMKLYPMIFDLKKEDSVFSTDIEISNHWMVVGYEEKIPFLQSNKLSETALNFPLTLKKDMLPYVGSLDFKGNPVYIKKVGDVTDYIKIKKHYEEKNYEAVLELSDDIIDEYPNSLFMAELLFYKIKAHDKLKNSEAVIEVAKKFLTNYSADENIAEVLSLLAKAYDKDGLSSDADYFYDRLFSEHYDSVHAKWGLLYMAESLEASGSSSKARDLYLRAIKETQDLEVGVVAGFKLAQNYMSSSNYKESAEYIQKVAKVKPEFFAVQKDESIDLMFSFVENEDYKSGSIIAKALLQNIQKNEDEYEELLKESGIWLSKTEDKKDSLELLNRYITEFSDGQYITEVKFAKDSLFFELNDENNTQKLEKYDSLMEEYSGDTIANRALYEKAKLLIQNAKYNEALKLEPKLLNLDEQEFKDVKDLIKEAAIGTMKESLKAKECSSVLVISSKYNIELSNEWDEGVYECAMKGADFALAKKMADKNIKSKDINERKKWLYRFIKVDFATGNYSDVLEASKELVTLIKDDKNSPFVDVYRYIFDTYYRLENSQKMIEAMADILNIFKEDYKDVERYAAVMSVGSTKKDNNLVIEYGQKIMNIQKNSTQKPQSPFAEFTLYQAYLEKENHKEALAVIKSLDSVELKNRDRARQKYLLGNVLAKLWRDKEADAAYDDAIKADPASAWAKLAKSAKDI